ncbi:MAG: hypothetical protein COV47_04100 [Candidatus Diapherotrites archaeon CG11_big_fil_rev_8_21_14_0_20_37_9]|nr:MAG: hypothetical protein COV47_04100 [Candidatus Diapherotrites archaeon CG11_big_fil_rev_8_21_14_0_20_37_9]
MHCMRSTKSAEKNLGDTLFYKSYEMNNTKVLACADKEIIGKTFKEKDLEVTVEESFYKGQELDEKKLGELLAEHNSINLFGNKVVEIAVKQGFLMEADIIKIAGIKHAIILKV